MVEQTSRRADGVIALGCVIRGGTPHFEFVAAEAAKGVAAVSRNTGVPTIFGVVTADTIEQAVERVDHAMGPNKLMEIGHDLESVVLLRAMRWHAEHRVFQSGPRTVILRA